MRHASLRARTTACFEPLEGRRLLSSNATWVGPTFYVDDDQQQHQGAFPSIEAACLVAPPFSTIYVYPGLYNEMVHVTKPLRLLGSSHDRRPRNQPPDREHDSIVEFNTVGLTGGIFNLMSNTIELDGFVIQNNASGPGVFTERFFSDYLIERNTLQNNQQGLYLNSNGLMPSVVYDNTFNGNNRPGPASGTGLYSDQGLRNALIEHNTFTRHTNASMIFDTFLTRPDGVTVRKNFIEDDSSIVVFNSNNVLIEQNFLRRIDGTGIFLGQGTSDVTVDQNIIDETSGSGVSANGAGAGVAIARNLIGDAGNHGISLSGVNGASVKRNVVLRSTNNGIRLNQSSNNEIVGNNSLHNGIDGIRVEAGSSSNNRIVGNTLMQNAEHDAHDDTGPGPGSGGTFNYWIDNRGKTQNRPGLLKNGTTTPEPMTAEMQSYDAALAADPYATGVFVMPTFEVPEETAVPILPDLDILGLVPDVLARSASDKPWLDSEHA